MSYDIHLNDPVTKQTIELENPHFMRGGTYVDKRSVISGDVFEKLSDVEASYKALLLVLKDNLNISFEEWDSFRHYIVPFWDELIKNYKKDPNIEIYNSKLLSAYYLLGVSIGLDKFEK